MKIHELKTDPEPFAMSFCGSKMYEVRINDRNFKSGDLLILRETKLTGERRKEVNAPVEYTGCVLSRLVTEVRSNYGMLPGWCILGVCYV